jgi:hypothetical protein
MMSVFGTDQYVNGLRLLRLVRLRRELRALWQLAILAGPLWFGLIIWVQAATPDDSDAWNRADADAVPGFIVIGCAFVVGLLGMILLRLVTGVTGRVAAALVPMASKGAEPMIEGDADALSGLMSRLRKKRFFSIGLALLFLLFTAVGVVAVVNVVPAYQANQGHGGTVVTIGKDATISGYTDSGTGRYSSRHRDYFLSTPDGKAIAEDSKPVDGQRWTVVDNSAGNDEAYLVGGHDYLLVGDSRCWRRPSTCSSCSGCGRRSGVRSGCGCAAGTCRWPTRCVASPPVPGRSSGSTRCARSRSACPRCRRTPTRRRTDCCATAACTPGSRPSSWSWSSSVR